MLRCPGLAGGGLPVPGFDVVIADEHVDTYGGFGFPHLPESLNVGSRLLRVCLTPILSAERAAREAASVLLTGRDNWFKGKFPLYIHSAIAAHQANSPVPPMEPPPLSEAQIQQIAGALLCLARHQYESSISEDLLASSRRILRCAQVLGWDPWLSQVGSNGRREKLVF